MDSSFSIYRKQQLKSKYEKLVKRIERRIGDGSWILLSSKNIKRLIKTLKRYESQLLRLVKNFSKSAFISSSILLTSLTVSQAQCPISFSATSVGSGINVSGSAVPKFVDIDSDGDQDMYVSNYNGSLSFFENTGDANSPSFPSGYGSGVIPYFGGQQAAVDFVDINADGAIDLFAVYNSSDVLFYKNIGTKISPSFSDTIPNPFSGITINEQFPSITFTDLDEDGDMDCLISTTNGNIRSFENTGNKTSPSFSELTGAANPFGAINTGGSIRMALYSDLRCVYDGYGIYSYDGIALGLADGTIDSESIYTSCYTSVGGYAGGASTSAFVGIDVGLRASPVFVDIDGDGVDELFVGSNDGKVYSFDNLGDQAVSTPCDILELGQDLGFVKPTSLDVFSDLKFDVLLGEGNGESFAYLEYDYALYGKFTYGFSFYNFNFGTHSAPAFTDIDGDGDKDGFFGESVGNINFFENDHSTYCTANGLYLIPTVGVGNPFDTFDFGEYSAPAFLDLNGDGVQDVLVGVQDGSIKYSENEGDANLPDFATGSSSPITIDVGNYATPSVVDIDSDGDLDVFVGEQDGTLNFFKNNGTAILPSFTQVTGLNNPLDNFDVGSHSAPAFIDFDRDGDMDAIVGNNEGFVSLFENIGNATSPDFINKTCPRLDCTSNEISASTTGLPISEFQADYMNTNNFSYYGGNGGVAHTSPGIFFKMKLPADSDITLTTCDPSTNFDTKIHVIEVEELDVTGFSNNDDGTCGDKSTLSFHAEADKLYTILVSGNGVAEGDFKLKMYCGNPCLDYVYYTNQDNTYSLPIITNAATDIEINAPGNPTLGPIDDVKTNFSSDTELRAGNSIYLGPGFETQNHYTGHTFHAYIQGCNNPINIKETDKMEEK